MAPSPSPSRTGTRCGDLTGNHLPKSRDRQKNMAVSNIHFFPVFTWLFIMASFFISYGIAVYYKHVEPDFPYISYTAIYAPERCYFAQLINIGACLLAGNVLLRYLQVDKVMSECCEGQHRNLNRAAFGAGCVSALGFSMVANFQTVVMRPQHYIGVGLAFGSGFIYCWMTSALTWKLRMRMRNSSVAVAQFIISSLLTIFVIVFGISKAIYKYKQGRGLGTKWDCLRAVYLVSTITEWVAVTLIVTFVLTVYPDFKKMTVSGPTVTVAGLQRSSGTPDTLLNDVETGDIDVSHSNHTTADGHGRI